MAKQDTTDWNSVVAQRGVEWEDGPDGGAVLLLPRFCWGPLAKWLQPRLKRPHIRVALDEFGSFAWRQFDGHTPFSEVAARMEGHFGGRIAPAQERLRKFLAILFKGKFVSLLTPANPTTR